MKRFVVIITSFLIILVFIAMNYLLWDRESLVALKESNQDSIDTLTRMNMTLTQEKNRLEQQTEDLNEEIASLKEKIRNLEMDVLDQKRAVTEKEKFILNMKEQMDTAPVKIMALNWVNSLNQKKYTDAYLNGGTSCSYWGNIWTVRIFSEYFDQNVEQIELLLNRENSEPQIEVISIKIPNWDMSVYIRVNVVLKEGASDEFLKQGENILHLACTYSEQMGQWVITSVYSEEVETEPETEEKIQKP